MMNSAFFKKFLASFALISAVALLSGCVAQPEAQQDKRAVVIVSGGAAVTPFTTNTDACESGLAAGNTATALREKLIADGFEVFTAPAMDARSQVVEPDPESFGAFGDCPEPLPANMTIFSTTDIDFSGEHLARFAQYLNTEFGVTEIDWVGHSNGGLYSRSATRILQEINSPVQTASLTTVGTPWMGSFPFQMALGEFPTSECVGDAVCEEIVSGITSALDPSVALSGQQLYGYHLGEKGWNQAQLGVLDDIPVHLIGGGYLTNSAGDPRFWPFDGTVSEYSALAEGLPAETAPLKQCQGYPLTHSIFVSDALGLDWQTALTWNDDVLNEVSSFISEVRAGGLPSGDGCAAQN
jgi:triacylglycerol lipase